MEDKDNTDLDEVLAKDPDLKNRLGSLEAIPEERVSALFTPIIGIGGNS